MKSKLFSQLKRLLRPALALLLVALMVLGNADGALAARSGGRAGGRSFGAPRRSMPPSGQTYRGPSGGYYPGGGGYYPGGGFGFPFLFPVFGIGGGFGGLFTLLIFFSIAGFLARSFRSATSGGEGGDDYTGYPSNKVQVNKVQVGLLANARGLQAELNDLARRADTSSPAGYTRLLQETTLALLRHPDYWAYAGSDNKTIALAAAEGQFNQLALSERSKFNRETLSNVDNLLTQAPARAALTGDQADLSEGPGEFIVVTLLTAVEGDFRLPPVRSAADLQQALQALGSVSSDRLLAVEVLWTPQAEDDTLTADQMLTSYSQLVSV
ncbi:DUF1517 domain-containing protein [Leptolyngbya sp. FACHB-261]|uniref:DUF1517 domain-containing protein n=1 Tax=Leptolyngbya sp. FACHB-261 TaxID=2692806 RepID=UPI001683E59B|nr:DUF1517 domain-containing protein [Leptolyngbya sp. FACHB-261]MBD2103285.1 DUF1517 domain-containing protein [Leptolyngbya sp. FACHB-261]